MSRGLGRRIARSLDEHRRQLLLAVAVLALSGAAGALVLPGADLAVGGVARLFVVLAGLAAGVAGVWTVVQMAGDETGGRRADPFDRVPEHVEVGVDELVGADVNEHIDRYESQHGWRRQRTIRTVRDRLGTTVVDTVVDVDGVDRDTAVDRLSDGSWTDDDRAAALFAEPGAIQRSIDDRVADWAIGDSFARRVEAVIDELRRRHAPRRRTAIERLDGKRTEPRRTAVRIRSADEESPEDDAGSPDRAVPSQEVEP